MLMIDQKPLAVAAGDTISLTSEVEIEAGVDFMRHSPARYTLTATVDRAVGA